MAFIKYTTAIIACLISMSAAMMMKDPHDPFGKNVDANEYGVLKTYNNLVDHFDQSNTNTFSQRYWVNDTYYEQGGPVILYLCGEWTCKATNPDTNAAFQIGVKHKGLLISLEHRFYGASQPFDNTNGGWSHQNLKYLNTTQALADTAAFIDMYKAAMPANNQTTTNDWLIVGGSYPGALVAWFKNLYPDHVKAAWSSSGVINAIEQYTEYDMDLYLQTEKNLGGCNVEISQVTNDIERIFLYGNTTEKNDMLTKFGVTNMNIDRGDFMSFISDIWAGAVQYGNRTYVCTILEHEWFDIAPIQIVANLAGPDAFNMNANEYDVESYLTNTTVDENKSSRQWSWQFCTEFGFFQQPNMQYPMRSLDLNHDYWINYCKRSFSLKIAKPAIDYAHSYYGDTTMSASGIFFINSIEDPWQFAGMRYLTDPENTQKNLATHFVECADCAHCSDLHFKDSNSQAIKNAQAAATAKIEEWMGLA